MYSTIMGFYEDYMKITILFFFCAYMIYYSYTKLYIYDSIFDSIVFFIMLLIMMCCIVPFNTSSVALFLRPRERRESDDTPDAELQMWLIIGI